MRLVARACGVVICVGLFAVRPCWAALSIDVKPAFTQPQPIGIPIQWSASAGQPGESVHFRFDIVSSDGATRLFKDFTTVSTFDWTPLDEGFYAITVTAINPATGDTGATTVRLLIVSRLPSPTPVVTPTSHPLVALYSAPPCVTGILRVRYQAPGDIRPSYTPYRPCSRESINLYVAGMRANQTYYLQHEHFDGSIAMGPVLPFATGGLPPDIPTFTVRNPPDQSTSLTEGVLLHSRAFNAVTNTADYAVATDLIGRVIWYYKPPPAMTAASWAIVTRPLPGGTFLVTIPVATLNEVDLTGEILRQTNATSVGAQLAVRGVTDPVGAFHHEAIRLANGHTLAIMSVERIVVDQQGPGPVDVLADLIVDLDEQWRVVWSWNSLDQLDLSRRAVLNEQCDGPLGGCPRLVLASTANDWTHSNTLHYVPADGSLVVSLRNQDWVIKINYGNGLGSGEVLWRMGPGGDFAIDSTDPAPWFSHQHDVRLDGPFLLVYDNANTRRVSDPLANSRGQLLRVDEASRRVTLVLNADLGHYSGALGSAQKLANGNYHFESGIISFKRSQAIEVDPAGIKRFVLEANTLVYRSFRMKSIYEP